MRNCLAAVTSHEPATQSTSPTTATSGAASAPGAATYQKSAESNNPPPPPYLEISGGSQQQQQQQGVSEQLRHASREVKKNLKNRWSSGTPPAGTEDQHLLSADAMDTPPHSSPLPAARQQNFSSAQLQKVINDTLIREREANLLRGDRQETVC